MTNVTEEVPWLSEREMSAWRSYMVATLMLRHRLHREMVADHELSLADYEVLVYLSWEDGHRLRMTELASTLGSTKSRLSHQIRRMEREGLVRREPDPADKRGVVAAMTDSGRALLETAAPTHVTGVREHIVDRLTPDEQTVMAKVFSKVLNHLTDLNR